MIPNAAPAFNFDLGDTADAIRETVASFSQEKIAPRAEAIDRDKPVSPRSLAADGRARPARHHHRGGGWRHGARLSRTMSWRWRRSRAHPPVSGLSYGAHSNLCNQPDRPPWHGGAEGEIPARTDQRVNMSARSPWSEPGSGSDVVSMRTRGGGPPEKKGDRYVLTGNKMWITNGPIAETLVVYAKTDPRCPARAASPLS